MIGRVARFLLLLVAAWCVMTFTHECGHIIGGWIGGGRLIKYDLLPWHLPYSLFQPDPTPLLTLWAGPTLGVLIPLFVAGIVRRRWASFIADFCLLANGGYLALGWLSGEPFLDTTRLLNHGTHPAFIVLYCALTIGWGYPRFRRDCILLLAGGPTQAKLTGSSERKGVRNQ